MGFIRVRQAEGPAHEFDISEAAYRRNKAAYKVVDNHPVVSARPAKYIAAKAAPAPSGKTAATPAGKE